MNRLYYLLVVSYQHFFVVSEDISNFCYTNPTGHSSGIRIARIVQEAFRLHLPDVRWFVLGNDDTMFAADIV